jgi:hypothetical protein
MINYIITCLFVGLSLFSQTALSASENKRWMEAQQNSIRNKSLNQLFIPGSHDSGTYSLEDTIAKNQDLTDKLNYLKYIGVGFVLAGVAKSWSKAQNLSIIDQLYAGVRYLDLRVGWRDDKNEFYIVHGLYGPRLLDVAFEIGKFLGENPKEIVIIQIGDLRYMPKGKEHHDRLISTLVAGINSKTKAIATKLDGITPISKVQDFWDRWRQAIIIYNNDEIANSNSFVFPQYYIDSYWANSPDLFELKSRLDDNLNRLSYNTDRLFVVQAQMSPNTDTIKNAILHPIDSLYKSLEDMAKGVKGVFSTWLQAWKNIGPAIIITDFVDENIAKQIIDLNKNF